MKRRPSSKALVIALLFFSLGYLTREFMAPLHRVVSLTSEKVGIKTSSLMGGFTPKRLEWKWCPQDAVKVVNVRNGKVINESSVVNLLCGIEVFTVPSDLRVSDFSLLLRAAGDKGIESFLEYSPKENVYRADGIIFKSSDLRYKIEKHFE